MKPSCQAGFLQNCSLFWITPSLSNGGITCRVLKVNPLNKGISPKAVDKGDRIGLNCISRGGKSLIYCFISHSFLNRNLSVILIALLRGTFWRYMIKIRDLLPCTWKEKVAPKEWGPCLVKARPMEVTEAAFIAKKVLCLFCLGKETSKFNTMSL